MSQDFRETQELKSLVISTEHFRIALIKFMPLVTVLILGYLCKFQKPTYKESSRPQPHPNVQLFYAINIINL